MPEGGTNDAERHIHPELRQPSQAYETRVSETAPPSWLPRPVVDRVPTYWQYKWGWTLPCNDLYNNYLRCVKDHVGTAASAAHLWTPQWAPGRVGCSSLHSGHRLRCLRP